MADKAEGLYDHMERMRKEGKDFANMNPSEKPKSLLDAVKRDFPVLKKGYGIGGKDENKESSRRNTR